MRYREDSIALVYRCLCPSPREPREEVAIADKNALKSLLKSVLVSPSQSREEVIFDVRQSVGVNVLAPCRGALLVPPDEMYGIGSRGALCAGLWVFMCRIAEM